MKILESEESDVDIIELQGEVENFELFDAKFSKDPVMLEFDNFILEGGKIKKDFNIIEKIIDNDNIVLKTITKSNYVYLFDKPPKYKKAIANSGTKKF